MLNTGSKAPEFVLDNDRGGETSLSELLHDGPLVLYFYPADFTPGCTKEACSIRDIHNDIQAVGLFGLNKSMLLQTFQDTNIIGPLRQRRLFMAPCQNCILNHKFNIDDTSPVVFQVEPGRF